jgi:hypothetical protein
MLPLFIAVCVAGSSIPSSVLSYTNYLEIGTVILDDCGGRSEASAKPLRC